MDEVLAGLFSRSYHFPVICLRYFNVFGTRQNPNSPYAAAIPIFIRRMLANKTPILYGDGGQTRDFIYVSDVARANILAAKNGPHEGADYEYLHWQTSFDNGIDYELQKLYPDHQQSQKQPARDGDIYHSYRKPK